MPTPDRSTLLSRWQALCSRQNLRNNASIFDDLYARYTSPNRHYHDIHHIAECLEELDDVRHLARDPDAIELAIWFHDCVYDAARLDNEEQSARIARRALSSMSVSTAMLDAITHMILATAHTIPPANPDEQLLTDIDLAPLGAPAAVFNANGQSIRQEYSHLDDATYAQGRAAILENFLNRPRIYSTDTFAQRYEGQARSNLARTIARSGA